MPYNTARKYYEGIQTRKDIYLYIIRYLKEHDYPPNVYSQSYKLPMNTLKWQMRAK